MVMWGVAAVPLVLGALMVFLAACTGVEVTSRLGWLRYLVAAGISTTVGWLVLSGTMGVSLWLSGLWETLIPGAWEIFAVLVFIGLASVLGAVSAYQTGKTVSARVGAKRVRQADSACEATGIRARRET